jgi:hypothetical protein
MPSSPSPKYPVKGFVCVSHFSYVSFLLIASSSA